MAGEARRRGAGHIRQLVILGDGAAWIWNLASEHLPQATQIVDLFHAREHLHDLAKLLEFMLGDHKPAWLEERLAELDAGDIGAICTAARAFPPGRPQGQRPENRPRLLRAQRPPHALRPLPWPGHVHRLRSGRGWVQGNRRPALQAVRHGWHGPARRILALRCLEASGRWEEISTAPHTARPRRPDPDLAAARTTRRAGHAKLPASHLQNWLTPRASGCATYM